MRGQKHKGTMVTQHTIQKFDAKIRLNVEINSRKLNLAGRKL